jgi:hypothetical protein
MRIVLIILVSIALGSSLGVGITWGRYGFATSATAINVGGSKTKAGEEPPPLAPGALAPEVTVDKEEFDFGAVERDSSVSHNFRFTNHGKGPLTLKKGGTTCQKCTIAELPYETVPPGESVDVTVQYHASVTGPKFRQSATILTNDPQRPRVELSVFGNVTAILDLQPSELVFSKLSVHDTRTLEAKLINHLSDQLAITSFELSDPSSARFVDVKFAPLDEAVIKAAEGKSGQLVSVTIKPGLPLGQFRQRLILHLDVPERPTIELPLAATIASDISIVGGGWDEERGLLQVGSVKSAEGAKRTCLVLIHGPDRNNVELSVGEVSPSFIKVTIGEKRAINDGAVVQVPVTVEIPPGSPAANHLGSSIGKLARITLETTHPEAKQVKLPVRFAVEN